MLRKYLFLMILALSLSACMTPYHKAQHKKYLEEEKARTELGIQTFDYSYSPEGQQVAMLQFDVMMATDTILINQKTPDFPKKFTHTNTFKTLMQYRYSPYMHIYGYAYKAKICGYTDQDSVDFYNLMLRVNAEWRKTYAKLITDDLQRQFYEMRKSDFKCLPREVVGKTKDGQDFYIEGAFLKKMQMLYNIMQHTEVSTADVELMADKITK